MHVLLLLVSRSTNYIALAVVGIEAAIAEIAHYFT